MEPSKLRQDAETIWRRGLWAVDSGRLVRKTVHLDCSTHDSTSDLRIRGHRFDLSNVGKIAVVGAGKAGAGMAAAIEEILSANQSVLDRLCGWVNVPADCVRPLRKIHLHAARPAGVNEPTAEGVLGAEKILDIVSGLQMNDLCIVLISGGGSALLPAPVPGITLADKLAVTRFLMSNGASIQELNHVRKRLSRIKGGKLGLASRAGATIGLIISDIVGSPLEMIASGPTVVDSPDAGRALKVLRKFATERESIPESVWIYLENLERIETESPKQPDNVRNFIIGHNSDACSAAATWAEQLGYTVEQLGSDNEGEARNVGRDLAIRCRTLRNTGSTAKPVCIISGGEPVVHLVKTDQPRKGGRNQEVVLAALIELWNDGLDRIAILSGGTDGEDGPTDAAGAVVDETLHQAALKMRLDPAEFLAINNSYPFFEATGGLIKTGPTHTNVMDLRVALVADETTKNAS